jgi:hypothetical protein
VFFLEKDCGRKLERLLEQSQKFSAVIEFIHWIDLWLSPKDEQIISWG